MSRDLTDLRGDLVDAVLAVVDRRIAQARDEADRAAQKALGEARALAARLATAHADLDALANAVDRAATLEALRRWVADDRLERGRRGLTAPKELAP